MCRRIERFGRYYTRPVNARRFLAGRLSAVPYLLESDFSVIAELPFHIHCVNFSFMNLAQHHG